MTNKTTETRDALYPEYVRFAILTDGQIAVGARVLSNIQADACGVDRDDSWKLYGNGFIDEFRTAVSAAFAVSGIANKAAEEGDLPALEGGPFYELFKFTVGSLAVHNIAEAREIGDKFRALIAADRAARNDDDEAVATVSRSNTDDSLIFTPLRDFSVTDGMKLYDRAARPVANKVEVEPVASSIDTPRFHDLLGAWFHSANASKLIAHIDQHVASQVLAAVATPPATTGASTVLTDEGITDTALQHSAGSMDGHWCFKHKNLLDFAREVAAQAGQVAVPLKSETEKALTELMSIVRIHSDATGENFAWAEMQYAEEVLSASESLRSPQEAAGTKTENQQ